MRLIITRHGETEENRAGIIQGHLPGVLSDLGKEQANKLAERLKDEKIDLIISSDLDRALDTAKAVREFHPDVDLVLDERLRERFLGKFQGKTVEEIKIPRGVKFSDFVKVEDGVEDGDVFFNRAKEFVGNVLERTEENILLVGHDGICGAVIGNLLEGRDSELGLENTSVSEYVFDGEKWNVVKFNCVEHLK